jgi:hypothetical protein
LIRFENFSNQDEPQAAVHVLRFSFMGSKSDQLVKTGSIRISTDDEEIGEISLPWAVFFRRDQE